MSVDWFTVLAQGINFLALVWLLKRFLYKPILDAIDEREQNIVARLEEAALKKADAIKEQDEFRSKIENFEQQKKELLDAAIDKGQQHRERIIKEARADADALRLQQKKSLNQLQTDLQKDFLEKMAGEIIEASRKVLRDLASADLEQQVVRHFVARLGSMSVEDTQLLMDAVSIERGRAVVSTAFALTDTQRDEISQAVAEISDGKIECQFSSLPELICGIELVTNDYKLTWDVSGYLTSLHKELSDALRSHPEAEA